MALKVFISSVALGLVQERRALSGLILGLGMTPIRFEDFTAAPAPSREVCLRAVADSDVFLLLLGEHYGTQFPDTGLSPTHEEYRAATNRGLPTLAFSKRDVVMEPRQAEFVAEVEQYPTGLFRSSFGEIGELLAEAGRALRDLPAATGALVFTPVGRQVDVEWRMPPDARDPFSAFGAPTVEVYLTPIAATLSSSRLRSAAELIPRLLREYGDVGQTAAIETIADTEGGFTASAARPPTRWSSPTEAQGGEIEGLAVTRTGQVCTWASLRRDHFGAVVDADSLTSVVTPLVRLSARAIGAIAGDSLVAVVPSIAISGARSVNLGRPELVGSRTMSTIAMTGPSTLTLPGDESAVLSAVATGAEDVAAELAARVVNALKTR
jgi:hypothetical protein